MKRPFPVWATLFTLLGIAILCGLGTWQVQRLEWKESLLAAIDKAYANDPSANMIGLEEIKKLTRQKPVFAYGTFHGYFRHDAEIAVGPRTLNGNPGYHIITPLEFAEGSGQILVNRGWVPLTYVPEPPEDDGIVTIIGTLREIPSGNTFTPSNTPTKGQWYSIRTEEMTSHFKLDKLIPGVMIYAESENGVPVAGTSRLELSNNHRSYAIFWFTMAALLALFYMLRFWIRPSLIR